jgi:ubiquinol-cytochrome c reductase cytochrome c1 subunit
MRRCALRAVLVAGALLVTGAPLQARAQDAAAPVQEKGWSFQGPFGTFDRGALQRGFQVFQQACAACHAIAYLRYGDLTGIGLSNKQAAAVAATAQVPGGYDTMGLPILRPAIPSDLLQNPWPNPQAARAASHGAYPPDLSLIVAQRPGGASYVDHLLTSYGDPPPGVTLVPNHNWNDAFPGHQIAMAAPLRAGQMTFLDGTKATVPQMSHDVTTFLAWATYPTVEERRQDGVRVILFLGFLLWLTTLLRRRIWGVLPRA